MPWGLVICVSKLDLKWANIYVKQFEARFPNLSQTFAAGIYFLRNRETFPFVWFINVVRSSCFCYLSITTTYVVYTLQWVQSFSEFSFRIWFNFLRFSTWSLQNHLNCDKKVESFYSVNYINVNYSVKYSTAEIFTFSIRFFSLDYNQNGIKIPNITV